MGPFRVLQLSIVILMLFGSTWLVRLAGMAPSPSDSTSTWLSDRAALAGVLAADNADNNNGGGNGGGKSKKGGKKGGKRGGGKKKKKKKKKKQKRGKPPKTRVEGAGRGR